LRFFESILAAPSLAPAKRDMVLVKKAEVLTRAGRFDEAQKLSQKIFDSGSKDLALLIRAEAEYQQKKFLAAIAIYESLLKDFPESEHAGEALYGMAYAHKALGNAAAAQKKFYALFEKSSNPQRRQEGLYNAMLLAAGRKDMETAIAYGEQYRTVFKNGALDADVIFLLGSVYERAGRHQKAAEIFKQFTDQFAADPRMIQAFFLMAYNLQTCGRSDEALRYYDQLAGMPNAGDLAYSALKNRALIFLNRETSSDAAVALDRLIAAYPKNDLTADVYIWLAAYYWGQKNFSGVTRVLAAASQAVKKQKPDFAFFAAETERAAGQCDAAVRDYDALLDAPGVRGDMRGGARLGKAQCLSAQKKFDAARRELEDAISESADDDTVMLRCRFALGELEAAAGQPDAAYKYFMLVAVLYLDPEYVPQALRWVEKYLTQSGRLEEAKKIAEEINSRFPIKPEPATAPTEVKP
ncbi:MAG: tetratricopeptide repeat protein, partial [Candidatus Omnitrophica bacterium]|nr:tetratricopeptide repeat protein [Candidatus Omnitrophota bacterium]